MLEYNLYVHPLDVDLEIMTRTFADGEAHLAPVWFFVSLKEYAIAIERRTNRIHRLWGVGGHVCGNQKAGVLWWLSGEVVKQSVVSFQCSWSSVSFHIGRAAISVTPYPTTF